MSIISDKSLPQLEIAQELAGTLLHDHKDLMPDGLAARLSSLYSDLTVMIDDRYGISNDVEPEV